MLSARGTVATDDKGVCAQVASSASDTTLDTIPKLLARNAARNPDGPAYREKGFGIWQSWSWAETAEEVNALARWLIQIGLEEGDHVGIAGRNRPRLYMAMVAIQSAGGVPVPVYQDSVADEMAYVLSHCSARFAIAGEQEQVDKILHLIYSATSATSAPAAWKRPRLP